MSSIYASDEIISVDNNGRSVVYDFAEDVVILPVRVSPIEGGPTIEQCDAVIANGREFLASCTALYGCFSIKIMEE